jgi:hypothetical protein
MPRVSKTNVDLTAMEAQHLQVATKTPTKGGRHKISWPQQAQTILSLLIKKSTSFFAEHLQASLLKTPTGGCAIPLPP